MNLPNFVLLIEPHISECALATTDGKRRGAMKRFVFSASTFLSWLPYHRLPCQIVCGYQTVLYHSCRNFGLQKNKKVKI